MSIQTIPASQLNTIPPDMGVILDVRTPAEHRTTHLRRPHIHVPLDALHPVAFAKQHKISAEHPLYLLCHSGKRATLAAEQFKAAGVSDLYVLEGGIVACTNCGQATQGDTTRKTISLERQVRIAAGAIATIGSLLALTLTPVFAFIPLAIGCGLVFAGITDRCGLALALAHAPWNKN